MNTQSKELNPVDPLPVNKSTFNKIWAGLGIAGLFITLMMWVLASPVGSSPDDDFHMASIWCSGDGLQNMCEEGDSSSLRKVALGLTASQCYATLSNVSAGCQSALGIFESNELVITDRGNFAGSYPPLYYSVMHGFATEDIQTSIILMRTFNVFLFCSLFLAFWLISPKNLKPTLFFPWAIMLVPLGLFITASVNPSSWAVMGVGTFFLGIIFAFRSLNRFSRWFSTGLAGVGFVLALGSRPDTPFFLFLAAAIAVFLELKFKISRKIVVYIFAVVALLVPIIALLLWSGMIPVGLAGPVITDPNGNPRSAIGVLGYNIAQLPQLWTGIFGTYGLGWLDTQMPASTWVITCCLVSAVIFSRISRLGYRSLISLCIVAVVLVTMPLIILQNSLARVGENVQARYLLPLAMVLVMVALVPVRGREIVFSRTQLFLLTIGLTAAQSLAIYTNMSRYIQGASKSASWNLNTAAGLPDGWWWPGMPLTPMFVWLIASVGFGLFLTLGLQISKRTAESVE